MVPHQQSDCILNVHRADASTLLQEGGLKSHESGDDDLARQLVRSEKVRLAPNAADTKLIAERSGRAVSPTSGKENVACRLVDDRGHTEGIDVVAEILFEIIIRDEANIVLLVGIEIESAGPALPVGVRLLEVSCRLSIQTTVTGFESVTLRKQGQDVASDRGIDSRGHRTAAGTDGESTRGEDVDAVNRGARLISKDTHLCRVGERRDDSRGLNDIFQFFT